MAARLGHHENELEVINLIQIDTNAALLVNKALAKLAEVKGLVKSDNTQASGPTGLGNLKELVITELVYMENEEMQLEQKGSLKFLLIPTYQI